MSHMIRIAILHVGEHLGPVPILCGQAMLMMADSRAATGPVSSFQGGPGRVPRGLV